MGAEKFDRKKLTEIHKYNRRGRTLNFNCLGATFYVTNIANDLKWIENSDAINFFTRLLAEGENIEVGDFLVIFDKYGDFIHIAVYTGKRGFWSKRGGLNTAYMSLHETMNDYREFGAELFEIRRKIKKEDLKFDRD